MSVMEISNLTKNFLEKMLSEGKRFDGRGLLDLSEIEISYDVSDKAEGSARVKIGKTEVIAGVKLAIGEPYPDSPDKGNLAVSGDLLPLASPRFESGPPGFNAIEVPRLVDRMIRESGMVDFEKLCIVAGEKVWTIFIDVYPINDDGSLIDASCIAAVAAMYDVKMPYLDKEGKIDYDKKTKDSLPLSKESIPIPLTFYKIGESIFIHPTREEEEAVDAKISFGFSMWNGKLMINSCQKGLNTTFKKEEINKMMDIISSKYNELAKLIIPKLKI